MGCGSSSAKKSDIKKRPKGILKNTNDSMLADETEKSSVFFENDHLSNSSGDENTSSPRRNKRVRKD
jgi:hypothetical protein